MVQNLPANSGDTGMQVQSWVRKIPWSRKWQSPSVFLLGKFHGQTSLEGYNLWCHKESDNTENTHSPIQSILFGYNMNYEKLSSLVSIYQLKITMYTWNTLITHFTNILVLETLHYGGCCSVA